jgi:hypothetical protein
MAETMQFLQTHSDKQIECNTAYHIIRKDPRVKRYIDLSMEDKWTEVTTYQIIQHFQLAAALLNGVPAHFVFNMDEMGHQKWADRQARTCFVSAYHEPDDVALPVFRTGKQITLVVCIAADDFYIKPPIVILRKTIDEDIFSTGLTERKSKCIPKQKGILTRKFSRLGGKTFSLSN